MVSNKRFVKTWTEAINEHRGGEYVSRKLGMSKNNIHVRAHGLRKRGVKLPSIPPKHREASVEELNNLIENYEV